MRGLTRNSLIFFISESTSAALTLLTGLMIARLLPVAAFGQFTAALAFASIVAVVVDSGMGMLAAKDIAQDLQPAGRQAGAGTRRLNQLFSWRLWTIAAACLLLLFGKRLLPGQEALLITALTPSVLLIGMTDFFCWMFKGAQRAVWCAGLQVSSRILLLVCAVIALHNAHPLTALLVAYGVAGVGAVVAGLIVAARGLHGLHGVRLPADFFRHTLPGIYKLGAILILSVAFTRVDVMLVARLLGNTSAGLFGAAGRIVDALRLIPMVVYSVYLPIFSMLHDQPEEQRRQFLSGYNVLLLLATALALIGSLAARPLFHTVLGAQYDGAVDCFLPLLWSCVPMFANILIFSLLYANNDHRTPFIAITVALTIEIVLDVLWLPRYGTVGAGWGRLMAEIVNCATLASGLVRRGLVSPRALLTRPALIVGGGLVVAQFLRVPWVVAGAVTLYYAVTVAWYWLPLLAVRRRRALSATAAASEAETLPHLVVVAPARNAARSIAGMAQFIQTQDYPADRRRFIFLIDSDDASDPSPMIAREAGAEVYQRIQPAIHTKGDAINELLTQLKSEPWDALLILDIDVRGDAQMLKRAAAHWRRGAHALQAAVASKNPTETPMARINHSAQLLSQLIQRGRSALGWSAVLSGNGMMLSRACLERLGWQTSTGTRLSDDGELNLRLLLQEIRVTYADDIRLLNEVATDGRSVRLQRRRWFAAYAEARAYVRPLLRKGLAGRWRVLEGLFTHVFLAGCSLSFVLGALWLIALIGLARYDPRYTPWAMAVAALWSLHVGYYLLALRTVDGFFGWSELKRLPQFLGLRGIAIVEGAILGARSNPGRFSVPAEHRE